MINSILEASIHSLVGILGSAFGRVVGGSRGGGGGAGVDGATNASPSSGLERLAIASILPILTTSVLWYTRTTVEVTDPEQSLWVQLWILQRKNAIGRVRRLFLLSPSLMRANGRARDPFDYNCRRNDGDEEGETTDRFAPPKLTLLPSAGVSAWTWFGLWPISVSSTMNAARNDGRSYNSFGFVGGGYKVTVWFAPSGGEVAKKLLLEGRKMWLAKRAQKTEIWLHRSNHSPASYDITSRKSRPLNSVIVEEGIKNALLADTTRFLQSEEWYIKKGIPFRRGYLLYGPPGCGKSSFITALAGSLRLPIVLIALGSKSIGDGQLFSALSGAPRDSIVLIEDVDCAFRKDDSHDQMMGMPRAVTLSGLLNAIDGVAAQEGRLIFLTTNHKELLSEALIRPGRVDAQYYLGHASKDGAGELFDQFFPPSDGDDGQMVLSARNAFVSEVESDVHSFAQLQGVLMQARDDPLLAAEGMRALFREDESIVPKPAESKNLKGSRVTRHERLDENARSHVALLVHAAKCEGCTSTSCKTIKKYIDHIKSCKEKAKSKCRSCSFVVNLSVIHARKCCVQGDCPVPFCDRIRKLEVEEEAAFVESLFDESNSSKEEVPEVDRSAECEAAETEEKKSS